MPFDQMVCGSPYSSSRVCRIDALPRLVGEDDVTNRINAEFDQLDRKARADNAEFNGDPGSWYSREVHVLFAGPRFLVVEESQSFYEDGAAHPNSHTVFHTYDLATGEPILWSQLLPPIFVAGDSSLRMDALRERYRRNVMERGEADCDDLTEDTGTLARLTFDFSLDVTRRALLLWPLGFSYMQTSCANPASIGVEELRTLGANPDLVNALEAAKP